jgi:hypothetical protein
MSYPKRTYLIADLFALCSVNLLAGMSGGGKTRLIFQLLEEIERYQTFFGFPCLAPIIPRYYAFDRTLPAIHDTLNSMKCELNCYIESRLDSALRFGEMTIPTAKETLSSNLIILDGLDCLVPKLIDSNQVGDLLFRCAKLATETRSSVWGALGTSKVKLGEGYAHPRERIIGSSFWARMTETNMLISQEDEADDNSRSFYILPRNCRNYSIALTFDEGRLVRTILSKPEDQDLKFVEQLPASEPFDTSEAYNVATKLGMSRATMFRSLQRLLGQRLIVNISHGTYKRVAIQ